MMSDGNFVNFDKLKTVAKLSNILVYLRSASRKYSKKQTVAIHKKFQIF
jgi:hypothetical protein